MATLHDTTAPRKKLATYGKAARRRIPDYGHFSSANTRPQVVESPSRFHSESQTSATSPPAPASPSKKTFTQRSKPALVPKSKVNAFDVLSDDEPVKLVHKKAATPSPPVKTTTAAQKKMPSAKATTVPQKKVAPPATSAVDVFDVPEDEAPITRPIYRATKPAHIIPQRPKQTAASKISSPPTKAVSKPPIKPSQAVYDIASSDEDVAPIRRPISKVIAKAGVKQVIKARTSVSATATEDIGSRKKMKMSPPHDLALKHLPANTNTRPQKPRGTSQPPNGRPSSPKAAQFTRVVVARPKKDLVPSMADAPKTPLKQSPTPQLDLSTPSPSLSDLDMMDVDPKGKHISPRGRKMWENLLDDIEDDGLGSTIFVTSPHVKRASPARSSAFSPGKPSGISKQPQKSHRQLPRRRLIDSLVEQRQESSDEDSSDDNAEETSESQAQSDHDLIMQDASRSQSVVPEPMNPQVIISDSQVSQGMGPKITYQRTRSMLAEENLMAELEMALPTPQDPQARRHRRGSIPTLKPLASFQEEDEDEESTGAAVRSVHELRKSGANNRFVDEVQDYLDRIGKPAEPGSTQISMRRSGLLDLASKMQDKAFARQFRENCMEQKLFLHLGPETDIVAGFVMVALLIFVLTDESMPHIVAQLRRQGISRLLIRLLSCQSTISSIARDKKTNMSKVAQSLLIEHHDDLLKQPIWENLEPQLVTPRTLALKCLECMVRQTREAGNSGDIFLKELTTNLFTILKSASDENSFDLPKNKQAINFHLALSALESHSLAARTLQDENIWINEFLPTIASTLEITFSRPVAEFGSIQLLILRLTLNVTNNNSRASDVFAKPGLMSVLGKALVAKFYELSRFLTEEEFPLVQDLLILIMGVMINFTEWSSAARDSLQSLQGGEGDPLDAMVQTFVTNQEKMSDATNLLDGQRNVCYGYLSVLLGHCSLNSSLGQRIQSQMKKPLVESIEEFIQMHKVTDSLIAADDEGSTPQSVMTERLEGLVRKLVK